MQKHEAIISQVYSVLHDKFSHGLSFINERIERFHHSGLKNQSDQGFNDDLDPSVDDLPITLVKDSGPGARNYTDLQ